MEKIKILYLITKEDVGGAQKYVKDLAQNLDKEKFEAKVITGGKNGVRFLSNAFIPYFFFINDWLALAEIFLILQREKADILHLNSSKAGVIGAMAAQLYNVFRKISRRPIIKVVFTAHGWVFNPDNALDKLRKALYVYLHKIAAKFQDRIINVSEYDRRLALRYRIAPPEKLETVLNGIDYKSIKFMDKQSARKTLTELISKQELSIANSEIWVGSIGRLVKEKNYESFIEAAALIKNQPIKFFIIGSGYEKRKLQSLINHFGLENKFFIIKDLSPAAPYLKAFDIFVLSSIKEGLPYTLLEAMAAELPIITTRIGGMTEVISERGLVMPPREPQELARAIEYFLNQPQEARELAQNAKQMLRDELTMEKMLQKTTAIYLTIYSKENL